MTGARAIKARRRILSRALGALAGLAVAAAAACGSPCQDLAERICNCSFAGVARDSCVTQVKNQLGGSGQPGSADQSFCQQKLATCKDPGDDPAMCQRLLTPQGRQDCGLAYGYQPDGGP